jgi:hypothetical protein
MLATVTRSASRSVSTCRSRPSRGLFDSSGIAKRKTPDLVASRPIRSGVTPPGARTRQPPVSYAAARYRLSAPCRARCAWPRAAAVRYPEDPARAATDPGM